MLKFIGFIILFIAFFIMIQFGMGIAMALLGKLIMAAICVVIAWMLARKVMS